MKTIRRDTNFQTELSAVDRERLRRIITVFHSYVEVEQIGQYRTMTADEAWLLLVGQVCVMGSARYWERLKADRATYAAFKEDVSLRALSRQKNQAAYLAKVLSQPPATRFPSRSARNLITVLQAPSVFRGQRLVLFHGLSHKNDVLQTRGELIARCPIFRLKSASDFMISIGLSHDVIALDTRIVGTLQKYFDYNLTPSQIQSHRGFYLSLEGALRDFCHEQGVSLALLDRLLFRFSSLGALELVMMYPEVIRKS